MKACSRGFSVLLQNPLKSAMPDDMLKKKIVNFYYKRLRPDDSYWRKAIETPGIYLRDYFLKRYPLALQKQTVTQDKEWSGKFPIDIVYTWVNGGDPAFRETVIHHKASHQICNTREAVNECRWQSRDELKYSLRSIDLYLPWVNHIYIVTNGQALPDWLDVSHPKLTIVTHDQIIDHAYLPTFNSHVIESCLHRIPGLSEHYLYMNDDVMFLRPALPVDFFSNDGLAYIPLAKSTLPNGPKLPHEGEAVWAAKNARAQLFASSGYYFDRRFGHISHPQLKSVAEVCEGKYKPSYDAFRSNKFRNEKDIVTCGFLHHCEAWLTGKAAFVEMDGWYLRIRDRIALKRYKRILKEKGTSTARLAMCVNDHVPEKQELSGYESHAAFFLNAYYPSPSRFEKVKI